MTRTAGTWHCSPLADVLVVDMSRALAGPHAAMTLGDLGARVIKVEPPQGDDSRHWGPPFVDGSDGVAHSTYFLACNRNKESIVLDLRAGADVEVFLQLVRRADVLVENFRPGGLARLGLAHERLLELNPTLVILSITGFGHDGPEAARAGYDQIAQGEGGLMALTGEPGAPGVRTGLPIADLLAGINGALGVLAALRKTERTGRGSIVRTSLLAGVVGAHAFQGTRHTVAGENPAASGAHHPSLSPYGMFATADGHVQIAVGSNQLWTRFASVFGIAAERWPTNADRVRDHAAVVRAVELAFASCKTDEVVAMAEAAGIPAGRVRDLARVYEWDQTRSQGLVLQVSHSALGDIALPGSPLRFDDALSSGARTHHAAPPTLDQHGPSIRRWLSDPAPDSIGRAEPIPQKSEDMSRDLTDPRVAKRGHDLEAHLKEPILDNVALPEKFGPVQLTVDEHKVKRFAFTQDDYSSWSFDSGPDGYRIGQPGLLTNDVVQLFTTNYKASATVGLHTEEQVWFHSPVRVGETVTLEGAYTDAYERRGQGYVVMDASVRGEDGREILTHRGVEIFRTRPGDLVGRGSAEVTGRRVTGEIATGAAVAEHASAQLAPGTQILPLRKEFAAEQAAVFSRTGEFVRNIHTDLASAREAGLAIPIVQGQQQWCAVAELLTRFFGHRFLRAGWLHCKFVNSLDVFEPAEISGAVVGTEVVGGEQVMTVEVWVRRSDRRLTVVGWASCPVSPAEPAVPSN